jgi:2,3-bisphosphoglycerate-dependent phosphoglycerate mutase
MGEILPKVTGGSNVLIVTHGNIIRAMRKHLENLSDGETMSKAVVGNGFPLVYHFDNGLLKERAILGDPAERKGSQAASQII